MTGHRLSEEEILQRAEVRREISLSWKRTVLWTLFGEALIVFVALHDWATAALLAVAGMLVYIIRRKGETRADIH